MKNIMKIWLNIVFLAVIVTLNGCLFETYHETSHYDLQQKTVPDVRAKANVSIREFENWSGTGRRMRMRTEQYRIVDAEYNRWAQLPNVMLSRFLANCFPFNSESASLPQFTVSGRLTAFEAEMDNKTFLLRGQYRIRGAAGQPELIRDFAITQPFGEAVPTAFAAAASHAADKLAEKIDRDIEALRKPNPLQAE